MLHHVPSRRRPQMSKCAFTSFTSDHESSLKMFYLLGSRVLPLSIPLLQYLSLVLISRLAIIGRTLDQVVCSSELCLIINHFS